MFLAWRLPTPFELGKSEIYLYNYAVSTSYMPSLDDKQLYCSRTFFINSDNNTPSNNIIIILLRMY